jgi:putative transposase
MTATKRLSQDYQTKYACKVLGVTRSHYYKSLQERKTGVLKERPKSAPRNKISPEERLEIIRVLCSENYSNLSPYQAYFQLLDDGQFLCSIRSMYRILKEFDLVRERRNLRRHGKKRSKPVLSAKAPNQVWSWDITKLRGPQTGRDYSLYVVLDIYSRCVVAWTVQYSESQKTATDLIEAAVQNFGIERDQLTLHADNGGPMRSKTMSDKLKELGVNQSHSRSRVSDDNAFSEAQFKTLKYHSSFPKRFDDLEDADEYLTEFFGWYNNEHRHSGIAYMTPAMVHNGDVAEIVKNRQQVLDDAYNKNGKRFGFRRPIAKTPPKEVGINLPKDNVKQKFAA